MPNDKKNSLGYIALWSVAMILALSAAIIGIVLAANDEHIPIGLLVAGIGVFVFIYAIKKIVESNNTWKVALKEEILSKKENILVAWTYPEKEWVSFAEKELESKKNIPIMLTLTVTTLVFIGMILGAIGGDALDFRFWKIALPITTAVAFTTWYISVITIEASRKIYLEKPPSQQQYGVAIAKQGILINGHLLTGFKYFGGQLIVVKEVEKHSTACLLFTVRVQGGEYNSLNEFYIPIPKDQQDNATQLAQEIRDLYFIPSV